MNEQRLIELETKISYQEILIEELQKLVHNHYLSIEQLEKNIKLLTDKVDARDNGANLAHEKPPHY